MAQEIPYDRQTINTPNPFARFSHRRRMANSVALAEKLLPENGVILDFGAGTGVFLRAFATERPDATLFAVEPFMRRSSTSNVTYIESLKSLRRKVDVISAFEVCEHLDDDRLDGFLDDAYSCMDSSGRIVLSVPIMIGAFLPIKELNRALLHRRRSEYSLNELIRGILGKTVTRAADPLCSHKGFDFRALRKRLQTRFVIELEAYSPLPLPWWTNSQVFFVCRKP